MTPDGIYTGPAFVALREGGVDWTEQLEYGLKGVRFIEVEQRGDSFTIIESTRSGAKYAVPTKKLAKGV